jgi:hypothetical protein
VSPAFFREGHKKADPEYGKASIAMENFWPRPPRCAAGLGGADVGAHVTPIA